MADCIPAQGVHHFRLTVSNVERAVKFYTDVLGFKKLMDLNPGAFLSNGSVGLGIGPHPFPDRAIKNDRFDENRIGLDHLSFAVPSRAALDDAMRVLDKHGVAHSEIRDLGDAFGDRLSFPRTFVGRGDMSRGGLLLRSVRARQELDYVPVAGAVRHGPRPPRLVPERSRSTARR